MIFKYQQHKIQSEIKQKIKNGVAENELSVFEVTSSFSENIVWKKIGKEFSFKGRLYDIVKMETQNGTLIWKCIDDIQETDLFAQLDVRINHRLSENPANNDFYKNLAKDYIKNIYSSPQPFFLFGKKICHGFKVEKLLCDYSHSTSPPPKP